MGLRAAVVEFASAEDEVVELDTWSEEDDGVEDPFEMEDEAPADDGADDDAFVLDAGPTLPADRGSSFPDLPKVSVSSLKVPKFYR